MHKISKNVKIFHNLFFLGRALMMGWQAVERAVRACRSEVMARQARGLCHGPPVRGLDAGADRRTAAGSGSRPARGRSARRRSTVGSTAPVRRRSGSGASRRAGAPVAASATVGRRATRSPRPLAAWERSRPRDRTRPSEFCFDLLLVSLRRRRRPGRSGSQPSCFRRSSEVSHFTRQLPSAFQIC